MKIKFKKMKKLLILFSLFSLIGCKEKLDLKPNTGIVIPKTAKEFESLLDNTQVLNITPSLGHVSADEYFIPNAQAWNAIFEATGRQAAIWQQDIYQGEGKIPDWNRTYSAVFYANNILDQLNSKDISTDADLQRIKGWALFSRAYAYYALVSIFSKAYDPPTATTDLGVPLKLNANIDEITPRSSLQHSYEQIISDTQQAAVLLNRDIPNGKLNRPSKAAAYALLARVYISMRQYDLAEQNADQALAIYSKLTDFNTLNKTAGSAFSYNSEEVIYFSQFNNSYGALTLPRSNNYGIDPALINLYDPKDLRLAIYYEKNTLGNYNIKPINNGSSFPFSGLATDELYLIKAECLARRDQKAEALSYLNSLVKTRMQTGFDLPITATNASEALDKILTERRKALVWRGIRWTDLKRLNLEQRNISLKRDFDGQHYTLEPNSSKYVLPIPDDEIALSGIQQNIR